MIDVDTPALLVDRDVLEGNIARMAAEMRDRGLAMRPHVKTHKIPRIAELQLAAGAAGITVATVGEAEVFVEHGATDVFIAYPLWFTARLAERVRRLAERARLTFGVDSAEAATNAGRLLGATAIEVLVEVDSGHHRSGVAPDAVVAVAEAARDAGLRVVGAFTFPGHGYGPGAAAGAAAQEHDALARAGAALRAAGFEASVLSGGSTPTARATRAGVLTEARPGVYVFGDAQQLAMGHCAPGQIALTVLATVVSVHDDRIVLDAGSKVLGGDRAPWLEGFGHVAGVPERRVTALSEHHATVPWPAAADRPARGERLRLVPNHVCLVVNLVDEVVVVRGESIEETWPVAARGRNS